MSASTFWWMKQIWICSIYRMTLGNFERHFISIFYKHFPSNAITKQWLNKAFTGYHWLFISWENCASKPDHTVAIIENIIWNHSKLPLFTVHVLSIFRTWLIVFFFRLENRNTSLNKWVIFSSKSLCLFSKIETLPKSSKNKLPRVCNPKVWLQNTCSLCL